MPALGEEFRSAREARGLTLSDVAEQIHIRSVYLSAIENEDWAAIGAPVYIRGFIRTYARFLGLDAEDAVQRFNETRPPERQAVQTVPLSALADEPSGPSRWAMIGGIAALVLVAFVAFEWWQFSQSGMRTRPLAAVPRSSPAAAARPLLHTPKPTVATPSPRPLLHHSLAIHLTQASWLRVVVDGRNAMEGTFPAGTTRTFTGNVADLRVGNAAGVDVSVNGSPAKTLGGVGDVVEQKYTL
jgi:transcriptional regulator with XRE-family HTH domain